MLSTIVFPVLGLELEELITVPVSKDRFSLMTNYAKDYHFDFYESKSDQSLTLYVPRPLNGCVQKYTIPRTNDTSGGEKISPVLVAGHCPSKEDNLRGMAPRPKVEMYWISLYGEKSMIGFHRTSTVIRENEWKFVITSPDSDELSLFSNLGFSSKIYSFFVDTDLSLIGAEYFNKRIVRLERDVEQVTVLAQLERHPLNIGPGPMSNQIVYSYRLDYGPRYLRHWFLKDLNPADPIVPDVDLGQYFGHVVPGDLASEPISASVISVVFDNSFHDLNVAVVTYLQMGDGDTSSVYFVVYHGPRGNISFTNATTWSKLEAIHLPLVENSRRNVYSRDVIPLISETVVKDGVLMVALGNSVTETLTFFKFDYGTHMPFRVVAVASVLRNLPFVDQSFAKAMGFAAETIANGESLAPKLQEATRRGNPHYDDMERSLFTKLWE